jgi:hypothetical protein
MYFLLPAVALVVSNTILVFAMKKQLKMVYYNKHVSFVLITRTMPACTGSGSGSSRNTRSFVVMRTNQLSVNKTILLGSVLFILMTLPTSIASFFFTELIKTEVGHLLLSLADSISLTFNAFNMFIYVLLNKIFRHEFKNFFGKLLCFGQKYS